jgi:hypothetical protein
MHAERFQMLRDQRVHRRHMQRVTLDEQADETTTLAAAFVLHADAWPLHIDRSARRNSGNTLIVDQRRCIGLATIPPYPNNVPRLGVTQKTSDTPPRPTAKSGRLPQPYDRHFIGAKLVYRASGLINGSMGRSTSFFVKIPPAGLH